MKAIMTKREFLRRFKKYAKAVNKSKDIPFSVMRNSMSNGTCPFRSKDGYYYEVLKSGKAVIMSTHVGNQWNKEFRDCCRFVHQALFPDGKTRDLHIEMLAIVEFLEKKAKHESI
jgi:hypothetical protein